MNTQDLDNGSMDTVETSTTSLDSSDSGNEIDEDGHDPCGTSYLFTPKHIYRRGYLTSPTVNTISKLRLGAADACHSCQIVLDALTTYCSGMLSLDSIRYVYVPSAEMSMRIWYWLATGASQDPKESHPPKRKSIEIELFQVEGQELQITHNLTHKKLPVLTRRIPSGDTSSDQAVQTLSNWIETCITQHGACAGYKISQLLNRIFEIDGNHVYLRERLNTSAMYACLSHCWGSSGPTVRLDKTSFSLLTNGIAIDQLPKTFADSIHLCARLGIRFVWIDACCIMQDDNDDWKEAAATMANIYEQAHLTIAATWARDSNSGLYAPHRERYKAKRLRDCGLYVREVANGFPLDSCASKDFPLLTRAWVYQERLLSSRMIHFVKNQMYWQCPTLFAAESGVTYDKTYPAFMNSKIWPYLEVGDDPVRRWHTIVASYTRLNLTYANDRLPAIAAIVEREMRLRPDDTYIAGICKSSLLTDISWQRGGFLDDGFPVARLGEHVPTWAWPTSNTKVHWFKGKIERSVKLVDLSFTRIGPAQVGQVLNASITLEGHTYKTRLTQVCHPEYNGLQPRIELVSPACEEFNKVTHYLLEDFDWRTGDRRVRAGDTLLVMPIKFFGDRRNPSSFGILLYEVANGDFERMGVLELRMKTEAETYGVEAEQILRNFIDALPIRQVKII